MMISCDTCEASFTDSDKLCVERARLKGWRVWQGFTMGGRQAEIVACPGCARTTQAKTSGQPVQTETLW